MAVELKGRGVASVSLWPGAVQTELVSQFVLEKEKTQGVDNKVHSPFTVNPSPQVFLFYVLNLFFFGSVQRSLCQWGIHRSEWDVHRQPGKRWDYIFLNDC